ncbi:MAG: NYN domain-containing protein, partial [Porticoccaceae bacterium]
QEGKIVQAQAYAIDRNNAQQQSFQQILREIGFNVKLKPYIQRGDGSAKGDWDVGIAIDMMDAAINQAQPIDRAILLSGDGDFDLLLQRLRASGVDSTVYGVPSLTATSLINAATEFRAIEGNLLLK